MKLYDVPQIGAKMYLRDETDLWGFLQNGEYEPQETELVKKIVKKDWVCLDIGANIGYYTILMAKLGKEVTAFEPEPSNLGMVRLNIKINNLWDKCYFTDTIASDFIGESDLYLCDASHGMHRTFKSKFGDIKIKVDSTTVDSIVKDYGLDVDFIKIDVEGSEYQVLRGMVETIDECNPTMLIEFHPPTLEESGTYPRDVYSFLKWRGYKITLVHPYTEITNYEQLDKLTRNESGGQNILCQ